MSREERRARRARNVVGHRMVAGPARGRAEGAAPGPADVGISAWPQCATCTMRKGHWCPVEGYSLDEQAGSGVAIRRVVVVRAECSHGRGMNRDATRVQAAKIEVPYFWGEAQKYLAIKKLVFFTPGDDRPENRMLV